MEIINPLVTTNGSNDELIAVLNEKLQALIDEVAGMRSEQATANLKIVRIIDKWDALGAEI